MARRARSAVAWGAICFIFGWNELLLARVLTSTVAASAPAFPLPALVAGFAAQDKLVQGLSMGAVK